MSEPAKTLTEQVADDAKAQRESEQRWLKMREQQVQQVQQQRREMDRLAGAAEPIHLQLPLDADLADLYLRTGGSVRPMTPTDILLIQALRLISSLLHPPEKQNGSADSGTPATEPAEPAATTV